MTNKLGFTLASFPDHIQLFVIHAQEDPGNEAIGFIYICLQSELIGHWVIEFTNTSIE